jgi:hypothetical protein
MALAESFSVFSHRKRLMSIHQQRLRGIGESKLPRWNATQRASMLLCTGNNNDMWTALSMNTTENKIASHFVQPPSLIPRLAHQLLIFVLLHLQPPLSLHADCVETWPV